MVRIDRLKDSCILSVQGIGLVWFGFIFCIITYFHTYEFNKNNY